jgi:hypothetical protein
MRKLFAGLSNFCATGAVFIATLCVLGLLLEARTAHGNNSYVGCSLCPSCGSNNSTNCCISTQPCPSGNQYCDNDTPAFPCQTCGCVPRLGSSTACSCRQ